MLDEREICIYKARSVNWSTRCSPELSGRCRHERALIERMLKRVHLGGRVARGIRGHSSSFVGVSHLIGAIKTVPVPRKTDARGVSAVDHKKREPRGCTLDHINFPVSQDRIDGPVPVSSKSLALSER